MYCQIFHLFAFFQECITSVCMCNVCLYVCMYSMYVEVMDFLNFVSVRLWKQMASSTTPAASRCCSTTLLTPSHGTTYRPTNSQSVTLSTYSHTYSHTYKHTYMYWLKIIHTVYINILITPHTYIHTCFNLVYSSIHTYLPTYKHYLRVRRNEVSFSVSFKNDFVAEGDASKFFSSPEAGD